MAAVDGGVGVGSVIGGVVERADEVVVGRLKLLNRLPSSDVVELLDESDPDEEGKCKLRSRLAVRGSDVIVVVAVVDDDSVVCSMFRIP